VFTHLWKLLLSSVPRMPSSRRRVVWVLCAGASAVFKDCQYALAAGVSTIVAHLRVGTGQQLAETARREQRQRRHVNAVEVLQRCCSLW
jgi:hypothetical protein